MSMFDNLEVESGIQKVEDTLGGFAKIEETGLNDFVIKKAYAGQSSGGAYSISLELEREDKATLRVTEYITSGAAKGCKNYYIDKSGNKQYLPGYNKMHSLDVLLTGADKPYPSTTEGKVMLWDNDLKKEIPQEKQIISQWLGKKVKALVMKKLEDKQVKGQDGNYYPTAEIKEFYEVQHFLDADSGQTLNERTAGVNGFKDKWLKKFDSSYVHDKRNLSKNTVQSEAGSTPNATAQQPSEDSPFSN
ncbi:MAG: hypothetical protein ACPG9K_01075 [Poseidonibacter sp.]